MLINLTLLGSIMFVLALIFIPLTLYFAQKTKNNLPLVFIYSLLFNWVFPPLGWYYCRRKYKSMNSR